MATKTKTETQTSNGNGGIKKTECKVTREEFARDAQPIRCTLYLPGVGPRDFVLLPKTFKKSKDNPGGSMGYQIPGNDAKGSIVLAGKPSKLQVDLRLYVVGSNQLPE